MEKTICSECKQRSVVSREGTYETVYVDRKGRSRPLKVPNVRWLLCEKCGDVVLEGQAMAAIETARRKALRLLGPEEIRDFRLKLGRTQAEMSELLGIGAKTYCRWESGSFVQSESSDRYLRILMSKESNVSALEGLAKGIGTPELAKVEAIEDMQRKFKSINVRVTMEASKRFVEPFVRGELQVA